MTELAHDAAAGAESAARGASAGAMLRSARERQGLQLAELAAAIKVAPRKLQALEADRLDELPDIAFARALAKAVCRALKIDAGPVLDVLPGLPQAGDARLEQITGGLRTPFRERSGHQVTRAPGIFGRPLMWTLGVLLLGLAAVFMVRSGLLRGTADVVRDAAGVVSGAPDAVAEAASAVAEAVQAAPVNAPVADATKPGMVVETITLPLAVPAPLLVLRASAEAWVDVQDAAGQTLVSRALRAGETLNLEGRAPLRATIGNVSATSVIFRGEPVNLDKVTKGNVARLELQ